METSRDMPTLGHSCGGREMEVCIGRRAIRKPPITTLVLIKGRCSAHPSSILLDFVTYELAGIRMRREASRWRRDAGASLHCLVACGAAWCRQHCVVFEALPQCFKHFVVLAALRGACSTTASSQMAGTPPNYWEFLIARP